MPARRKPQLSHQGVAYKEVSERFRAELLARERQILKLVGFFEEFGDPDGPAYTGKDEGSNLIDEITGLLATASAIRIEAGHKAPSKVIATLTAIIKDPKLALLETTEPEARGAIAAAYQRQDEPAGTFWFDIYGEGEFRPHDECIRFAAEKAIVSLKTEATRGRPLAYDSRYLTLGLRDIFLRFNDRITRQTGWSSHGDGDFYQKEEGRFFKFVEEVLQPLHRFYRDLPTDGDVLVPELSADHITRQAVSLGPVKRPDAHLTP